MSKLDRTVYIGGEIDAETSAVVIDQLIALSRTKKPIQILINSVGGDAGEALAIFDAIKLMPVHTNGIVIGQCYSAAPTILQACTVRLLTPNSRLMLHTGTFSVGKCHAEEALLTAHEEMLVINKHDEILAERSGQSLKRIKRISKFSKYMSASEAVKEGFADKIITRFYRT